MLVTTYVELCVGGGQCVLASPEVFDQDEDTGTVILLQPSPPDHLAASVEEAIFVCPARAIAATP